MNVTKTKSKIGLLCIIAGAAVVIGYGAGRLVLHGNGGQVVSADAAQVTKGASPQPAVQKKPAVSNKTSASATANTSAGTQSAGPATTATQTNLPPPASVPTDKKLFVNANSSYTQAVRSWSAQNPSYAAVLQRLSAQPMAEWFGGWNANVQADANQYVTAATAASQVPVLIAYNIPNRDCGSYSAGGVANASAYHTWIQSLASGIGAGRPAIVILEPDALAANCYSSARAQILQDAVTTLRATTAASIYLDAGHSSWIDTKTMATRLNASGIANATGFSLNVSNFQSTASNVSYGKQLSQATGGKHFLVDTSRNGNGPAIDNQWCNPSGRAIGESPTLSTGQPLVDAYVWAHGPGGSDGQCGPDQAGTSAPSAGTWWPESTLEYLRNSGWL